MYRATWRTAAPVYCRIIDTMRLDEPYARPGTVFPIRVELGEGVTEATDMRLQELIDLMMSRSTRFATVKGGFVYDKHKQVVKKVEAYGKYIITGNMRGGYVKGDYRFGPRLTGFAGATTKPGLKWNGEDL